LLGYQRHPYPNDPSFRGRDSARKHGLLIVRNRFVSFSTGVPRDLSLPSAPGHLHRNHELPLSQDSQHRSPSPTHLFLFFPLDTIGDVALWHYHKDHFHHEGWFTPVFTASMDLRSDLPARSSLICCFRWLTTSSLRNSPSPPQTPHPTVQKFLKVKTHESCSFLTLIP
jgi:hypothetical protein